MRPGSCRAIASLQIAPLSPLNPVHNSVVSGLHCRHLLSGFCTCVYSSGVPRRLVLRGGSINLPPVWQRLLWRENGGYFREING